MVFSGWLADKARQLDENYTAKVMRKMCEEVSPLHKFPKPLYVAVAKYTMIVAYENSKQSGNLKSINELGVFAAFYLCANAALHSSILQAPAADAASKVTSEEATKLKSVFDKVLMEVAKKFAESNYYHTFNLFSVATDFIESAYEDPKIFSNLRNIVIEHGQRCVYSEWLNFFNKVK